MEVTVKWQHLDDESLGNTTYNRKKKMTWCLSKAHIAIYSHNIPSYYKIGSLLVCYKMYWGNTRYLKRRNHYN